MIHYHGGVLHTGAIPYEAYAGRHFCVSFAYPEKMELYHQIGQSVCVDNGAFSLWKEGRPVDFPAFYEWVEPWLAYQTTWAIIPDVMDGTEEENDQLIAEWPFDREKGAPVYHIPESLDRLDRLCDEWPLICLGISSERYGRINCPKWKARMEQIMDVACDDRGFPRTRMHLLRGLAFSSGPYPIYSADSASVARSWSGSPKGGIPSKDVAKFFAQFDGRNPPPRWERPVPQEALFEDHSADEVEDIDTAGPLGEGHPDEDKAPVPIQRMASNRVQGAMDL